MGDRKRKKFRQGPPIRRSRKANSPHKKHHTNTKRGKK